MADSVSLTNVKRLTDNNGNPRFNGIYLSNSQLKSLAKQLINDPSIEGGAVKGLFFMVGQTDDNTMSVEIIPYSVVDGTRQIIENNGIRGNLSVTVFSPNDGTLLEDGTPDDESMTIENNPTGGGGGDGVAQKTPPPTA